MSKLKENEYQCEACGGIYEKGWSDEEANAEADKLWSKEQRQSPQAIICDDCFNAGMLKMDKSIS